MGNVESILCDGKERRREGMVRKEMVNLKQGHKVRNM